MFINCIKSDGGSVTINSDYIEYYERTNGTVAKTKIFCQNKTFYVKESKETIDKLLIKNQYD